MIRENVVTKLKMIRENIATILNGDVLASLKTIPDEFIDCVISSPPYYGLRFYKGAQSVWGGNPNCVHEWEEYFRKGMGGGKKSEMLKTKKVEGVENFQVFDGESQKVCKKCNAWYGQLGLEPTYELYEDHLMLVMNELKRVLKKTGTLFWNMGDSYAGSGGAGGDYNVGGIREGQPKYKQGGTSGIRDKSLMMIPERFAASMVDSGWILRNKMIWYKRNAMPTSAKDRLSVKWEYVFFFTKSGGYYFNLDAVRNAPKASKSFNIRVRDAKKGTLDKKWNDKYTASEEEIKNYDEKNYKPYAVAERDKEYVEYRNLPDLEELSDFLNKYRYELDFTIDEIETLLDSKGAHHWFNAESYPSSEDWERLKAILKFPDSYDDAMRNVYLKSSEKRTDPKGANPGDVILDNSEFDVFSDPNIQDAFFDYLEENRPELLMNPVLDVPIRPHNFAHFAVFPETLVNPLIQMGCPPNGIVLDPFAGSGTVGVVAKNNGLDVILIEISKEYVDIIKKRLGDFCGTVIDIKEGGN